MLFHANQKFLQGNIRPAVLIHASDGRTNPRPLSISNVIWRDLTAKHSTITKQYRLFFFPGPIHTPYFSI